MRIFPDGAKKKPTDNFAGKTPRAPAFFAAKCVPSRSSTFHFLHGGAKRKTQRWFRRKMRQGFGGVLAGKCVPGRN